MGRRYGDQVDSFKVGYNLNSKQYHLHVERLQHNNQVERYKITGESSYVIVESNRPLLRAKGLKHKPIDWKLLEGVIRYPRNFREVLTLIEKRLQSLGG